MYTTTDKRSGNGLMICVLGRIIISVGRSASTSLTLDRVSPSVKPTRVLKSGGLFLVSRPAQLSSAPPQLRTVLGLGRACSDTVTCVQELVVPFAHRVKFSDHGSTSTQLIPSGNFKLTMEGRGGWPCQGRAYGRRSLIRKSITPPPSRNPPAQPVGIF